MGTPGPKPSLGLLIPGTYQGVWQRRVSRGTAEGLLGCRIQQEGGLRLRDISNRSLKAEEEAQNNMRIQQLKRLLNDQSRQRSNKSL